MQPCEFWQTFIICFVHADILSPPGFPLARLELTVPHHISHLHLPCLLVHADILSSPGFPLARPELTVPHHISLDSVCITPFGHARVDDLSSPTFDIYRLSSSWLTVIQRSASNWTNSRDSGKNYRSKLTPSTRSPRSKIWNDTQRYAFCSNL